jgi:hypothetical protein
MTKSIPLHLEAGSPWVPRIISDYTVNTGVLNKLNIRSIPEKDVAAVRECIDEHKEFLRYPFNMFYANYLPTSDGATTFSIRYEETIVINCVLALRKPAANKRWKVLKQRISYWRDGSPSLLYPGLETNNPQLVAYYLAHGCPDLIVPDIKVSSPEIPFLATLVAPPWHRSMQSAIFGLAIQCRNAVARALLQNEWWIPKGVRNAKQIKEVLAYVPAKNIPFTQASFLDWFKNIIYPDTSIAPLTRHLIVSVSRDIFCDDSYVKMDRTLPVGKDERNWVLWHVQRGRLTTADAMQEFSGVYAVSEYVAVHCEHCAQLAMVLQARAWFDFGYDPDHQFQQDSDKGEAEVTSV